MFCLRKCCICSLLHMLFVSCFFVFVFILSSLQKRLGWKLRCFSFESPYNLLFMLQNNYFYGWILELAPSPPPPPPTNPSPWLCFSAFFLSFFLFFFFFFFLLFFSWVKGCVWCFAICTLSSDAESCPWRAVHLLLSFPPPCPQPLPPAMY